MLTHRLYRRILLHALVLCALVTVTIAGIAEFYTQRNLAGFLQQAAEPVARQTAERIAQHALANDVLAMNLQLSSLVEDPAIRSAQLFGVDHRLIAAAGDMPALALNAPGGRRVQDELVVVAPVTYDNVLAGHLRLTWSLSGLQDYTARLRILLAAAGVLLLGITLFFAHRLGRELRTVTSEIAARLDGLGLKPGGSGQAATDELGEIAARLRTVAGGDTRDEETPALPAHFGAPAEPELCSVLVMEPVALHELLDRYEAERINGELRRGYELVRRCASLYQARLCLIEHNRVLLLFTGGSDDEPEMFRAICCARLIMQLSQRMRNERTGDGGPRLHFRGIVHAGEIDLPDELSDEVHLAELDGGEGAVIRMAARMLEHAKRDEVLVSAAAIDHPTVLEKARLGKSRNARTRESERPLALFPVTGLAPGYEILQERQGENLLYTARA